MSIDIYTSKKLHHSRIPDVTKGGEREAQSVCVHG